MMPERNPADSSSPASEAGLHEVNFFQPKTAHARADRNMVLTMVAIWGLAVFGFHFLLIMVARPTPEEAYTDFQSVWPKVMDDSADSADGRKFARAALAVLGKNVSLLPEHRDVVRDSLNLTILKLIPAEQKPAFVELLANESRRQEALPLAVAALELKDTGFDKLRRDLLPAVLQPVDESKRAALGEELPGIMKRYLVHQQSFLTDTRFMGFPFHYWYTAQFLLILFVGLCLLYSILTERLNTKYNFQEN